MYKGLARSFVLLFLFATSHVVMASPLTTLATVAATATLAATTNSTVTITPRTYTAPTITATPASSSTTPASSSTSVPTSAPTTPGVQMPAMSPGAQVPAPTPANPAVTTPAPTTPTTPMTTTTPATPATPALTVGEKQWKLGFKDENKDNLIREYVIDNQTVNNWTELLTFHKFKFVFPPEITPVIFAENQLSALKSKGYQVLYTVHEQSPQEVIVEFRIVSPIDDQEDEIQRIIKTPTGEFIIVHYAIRKSDLGDAERAKWISALKNIDPNIFNS